MSKFLGGKFATQKDISRVLAKRLKSLAKRDVALDMTGTAALIGGERATSQIIRYKKKDSKPADKFTDLNKYYHVLQRAIVEKRKALGESKKDIEADLRAERERVTGHKDWTKGNVPDKVIEEWVQHLRTTNYDALIGDVKPPDRLSKSERRPWLKAYRLYEKKAWDWISSADEIAILRDIVGVRDGKISNATPEQIAELTSWARQIGEKPKNASNLNNVIISAQINKDVKWGKFKTFFMTHAPPIWWTAKKMGAKKLSDKMLSHAVAELRHIGEASLRETRIMGLLKGPDLKERAQGHRGDVDRLSVIVDKERFFERLIDGTLTDKQGVLADKIFKNINKDNKTRELRAKEVEKVVDGKKKKEMKFETPEAEAYFDFTKLRDYYWKELKAVAVRKWKIDKEITRAQLDRFLDDYNNKFVTDYFPRKVTKSFLKHYDPSAKWMKREVYGDKKTGYIGLIGKEARKQANELEYTKGKTLDEALKEAKEKGSKVDEERIQELIDKEVVKFEKDPDIELIAKMELENLFEFSPQTARNRYLFKRGIKLPEFIEVETASGKIKKVEVYEKKYAETMGDYSRTMAKFIATAQEYPEYTSIMRKYGYPLAKASILDKRAQNHANADWLLNRVKDQMGLGKSELVTKPLTATLQSVATATSKLALSFPTAGLKNIVVGTPQTMAAFGVIRTLRNIAQFTKVEARERAAQIGAKDLGTRPIEEYRTWSALEYPFKLSLMRPTES